MQVNSEFNNIACKKSFQSSLFTTGDYCQVLCRTFREISISSDFCNVDTDNDSNNKYCLLLIQ